MQTLTDEQKLAIDLELPPEAWDYESLDIEDIGLLFRLIFWTGYVRGLADATTGSLYKEISECVSTP